METQDLNSTLAGGVAGLALIQQVRWEQFAQNPYGELAKLVTGFVLVAIGYLMYRQK